MPAEVRSGAIPKVKADSPPGKWNRFVITLKKDRVTVILNGQTVIDHVQLPGIPAAGRSGSSITATRFSSRICSSKLSTEAARTRTAIEASAGLPLQSASNTAEAATEKSGRDTDAAVSPRVKTPAST